MSSSRGGLLPPRPVRSKGHVRVCVRVRPLMPHESARGDTVAVRDAADGHSLQTIISRVGDKETIRQYEFDRVCGSAVQQPEFFDTSGLKTLLDSALMGVNVSIVAYGQTGSGKTFSMSGHEEHLIHESFSAADVSAGLIPRSVDYLYSSLSRAQHPGTSTIIRASFCEIYNETIFDLLNLTGESLPLRWNSTMGFFVQGQLVVQCDTVDDVLAVVTEGHKNRTVGSHALNLDSSRSHSLLTLTMERTTRDPSTGDAVTRRSKIIFVDLAGSERLDQSKSEGLTALETRQINKSLFVLGKVIAALADKRNVMLPAATGSGGRLTSPTATANSGRAPSPLTAKGGTGSVSSSAFRGGKGGAAPQAGSFLASVDTDGPTDPHIPYRDSKLTKLLMDSLGGSALTIMIACVSPASSFLDETLSTLQYAMRASKIENAPVVQIDTKDAMILELRRENKLLRADVDVLRGFLGLPPEMPMEEALLYLNNAYYNHGGGGGGSGGRSVGYGGDSPYGGGYGRGYSSIGVVGEELTTAPPHYRSPEHAGTGTPYSTPPRAASSATPLLTPGGSSVRSELALDAARPPRSAPMQLPSPRAHPTGSLPPPLQPEGALSPTMASLAAGAGAGAGAGTGSPRALAGSTAAPLSGARMRRTTSGRVVGTAPRASEGVSSERGEGTTNGGGGGVRAAAWARSMDASIGPPRTLLSPPASDVSERMARAEFQALRVSVEHGGHPSNNGKDVHFGGPVDGAPVRAGVLLSPPAHTLVLPVSQAASEGADVHSPQSLPASTGDAAPQALHLHLHQQQHGSTPFSTHPSGGGVSVGLAGTPTSAALRSSSNRESKGGEGSLLAAANASGTGGGGSGGYAAMMAGRTSGGSKGLGVGSISTGPRSAAAAAAASILGGLPTATPATSGGASSKAHVRTAV